MTSDDIAVLARNADGSLEVRTAGVDQVCPLAADPCEAAEPSFAASQVARINVGDSVDDAIISPARDSMVVVGRDASGTNGLYVVPVRPAVAVTSTPTPAPEPTAEPTPAASPTATPTPVPTVVPSRTPVATPSRRRAHGPDPASDGRPVAGPRRHPGRHPVRAVRPRPPASSGPSDSPSASPEPTPEPTPERARRPSQRRRSS